MSADLYHIWVVIVRHFIRVPVIYDEMQVLRVKCPCGGLERGYELLTVDELVLLPAQIKVQGRKETCEDLQLCISGEWLTECHSCNLLVKQKEQVQPNVLVLFIDILTPSNAC